MKKALWKKIIGISLAAVMACGMLAGCGSGGDDSKDSGNSSSGESSGGGKNITLTFGSHQSGLPTSGIVQSLAKEFEAETGIKVDFQISPGAT